MPNEANAAFLRSIRPRRVERAGERRHHTFAREIDKSPPIRNATRLHRMIREKNISMKEASAALLFALATLDPALADMTKGSFTFSTARHCLSSGKLPADVCANAEKNAAAEFEEKAPRFPQRDVCEQAFGAGGCSLGFRGADGWAGKRDAVYFSPRRQGFRVTVKSEREATVVPLGAGSSFSPRSALRKDASINPRFTRAQTSAHSGFGTSEPDGPRGPLPPRPAVDPNFDCAAFLEPTDKGDPATGCAAIPSRR